MFVQSTKKLQRIIVFSLLLINVKRERKEGERESKRGQSKEERDRDLERGGKDLRNKNKGKFSIRNYIYKLLGLILVIISYL